jgi:predicted SnoaL-like aldol condensation-catalyzing enzyme
MAEESVKISHKAAAVSFLQLASSGRVQEAYRLYIAAKCFHHNPYFPGQMDALMTAMEENARQNPDKVIDIQRTLQDGDLVAVHARVRLKPGDLGVATVHIFRFENDRIVEMWDVGQAVPETSLNSNGMF